jgi:drug/metabolite transporter (DMT)-like permease
VRVRTVLAFSAIFIVWGSTYLAIKYAVAEIPPLLTAGVRHLIAGSVMLLWAWSRGHRASAEEWRHSAVVGALFFLIGHGTLHWAEQFVPSGVAALLIATEPVWIALLLAMTGQAGLRLRGVAGLLVGIAGVWVVVGMDPASGTSPLGALIVVVGAISWSAGVVYSQRAPLPRDATMRTATTLLTGAVLTLGASIAAGEVGAVRAPSLLAIASLAYLIVFGSIVAFTAYFWLLERYSATLVATHTFVNPAVAVILGWAIGGEAMSASLVLGLMLIGSSIALLREGEREDRAPEGESVGSLRPDSGRRGDP